jgi:hypothetical protein
VNRSRQTRRRFSSAAEIDVLLRDTLQSPKQNAQIKQLNLERKVLNLESRKLTALMQNFSEEQRNVIICALCSQIRATIGNFAHTLSKIDKNHVAH